MLYSFFLFPVSDQNFRLLLFPRNKCDRIETSTQYAAWSHFVVITFLNNLTYFTVSSSISGNVEHTL